MGSGCRSLSRRNDQLRWFLGFRCEKAPAYLAITARLLRCNERTSEGVNRVEPEDRSALRFGEMLDRRRDAIVLKYSIDISHNKLLFYFHDTFCSVRIAGLRLSIGSAPSLNIKRLPCAPCRRLQT